MNIEDLKKLDNDTLRQKLKEAGAKLVSLNMKKTMGGLEKPHEIKLLKKERAVIKTLLSYK